MTEAESENDPVALFICKPESGSQGRGIFISSKVEDLRITLNKQADRNKEHMNEYLKIE
jgi:glutathione synthase/RimK-type ligase-like ATP-grasp enzyme